MHILVQLKLWHILPIRDRYIAHISLTLYPWYNLRQNSVKSLAWITTKERNYLYLVKIGRSRSHVLIINLFGLLSANFSFSKEGLRALHLCSEPCSLKSWLKNSNRIAQLLKVTTPLFEKQDLFSTENFYWTFSVQVGRSVLLDILTGILIRKHK